MRNRTNLILGIIITLLLAVGAYWYWENRYNRLNWLEHYKDNKDPYGTHVIKNLLEDYYATFGFVDLMNEEEPLPWEDDSLSNYFLITPDLSLDTLNSQKLADYVARGNNAFISSTYFNERFRNSLLSQYNDCLYLRFVSSLDTTATFNFTHPSLSADTLLSTFQTRDKKRLHNWKSFSFTDYCDFPPLTYILGKQNAVDSNFIQIPHGQGNFYIHSTPVLFSNIQLLNEENRRYLEGVLAHIPKRKTYWDTRARLLIEEEVNKKSTGTPHANSSKSALSYILSQRPLKWAWYVLLFLTLAFLVFRSRRKQRIIPILAKNENTSLAFIHTIGNLYFQQGNHKAICEKKAQHFLSFIRNRYHLNTSKIDETFIHQLHLKSEVPKAFLKKLFNFYKNISSSHFVSENTLVEFHSTIQQFHQNCK